MLIRTYADIEKLDGEDALSDAERTLIENCKIGKVTILGDGTLPSGPSLERTIRAPLLRYLILGGCGSFQLHEWGIVLHGAYIADELDLRFAQRLCALSLYCCTFDSPIAARQGSFKFLQLDGCKLPALDAHGATVKGGVSLERVDSSGEISFCGACIGGQLSLRFADLRTEDRQTFTAQDACISSGVFLDGLVSRGEVSLSGADIGGQLSFKMAEFYALSDGDALNSEGATIKGDVFADGAKCFGRLSMASANVTGSISLRGGDFSALEKTALNLQAATVKGAAYLDRVNSIGEISFRGAEVGLISFEGAELNGGSGRALNCQRATVKDGFFLRNVRSVVGTIDITAAHIGDLVDDPGSWELATDVRLVGLSYENLVGPVSLPFRLNWLKKGATLSGKFHPQPYQQLAKFYRETGHRYEAREILVAKEIEQRTATRKAIRERNTRTDSWVQPDVLAAFNLIMDLSSRFVAGYGYKPLRSLGWIAVFVVAMTLCAQATWNAGDFAPNSAVILTSPDWKAIADGPSGNPAAEWSDTLAPGKDYETFYAFTYALDVVVPVLDLGQTDAWAPSPARGDWGYWMFYAQKMFIVAGWVVTAIAAAAISGMIRRDD
jgi:hypothetical protein